MSNRDDDYQAHLMEPYEFANELFAANNKKVFDEYMECKIKGNTSAVAFRIAFGEEFISDNQWPARVYAVEKNPYFREHYNTRLQATKVADMWNPKLSVNMLLTIACDKLAKDTARLAAIKELNVLTNITIVDENGKTKAGRGLADFYAAEGELVETVPPTEVAETDLPADTAETRH